VKIAEPGAAASGKADEGGKAAKGEDAAKK
jgi:hypothetical protein